MNPPYGGSYLYMTRKKKTIVSIVGARPQFVKLACLAGKLEKKFNHLIVHTGQHYDKLMSDVFFRQLDIPRVDFNLKVGSGNHGGMTGKIMILLEKKLLEIGPDLVLVYGDTNSTLAGALTSAKLHIPVGHIEAGLRSYDKTMPEEINRRLTDHVASLLFAPTTRAVKNLKKEGIDDAVVRSGDLMYELIDNYAGHIRDNDAILDKSGVADKDFLLVTMHRPGNVDSAVKMKKIVQALIRLKRPIFFPVHPRTLRNLEDFDLLSNLREAEHIVISQPLSYLDNLSMIYHARAVITDSGGMQKEALFLGTPCLTLREETEWVETLNWGNYLVGLSYARIKKVLKQSGNSVKKINYRIKGLKPSDIIMQNLSDYL